MNSPERSQIDQLTRRSFLKKTTLTTAAVTILATGSALAASPSDFAKEDCDNGWGKHDTHWVYYPPGSTKYTATHKQLECEDCKETSALVPV